MCDELPRSVDPRRLVELNRSLTGTLGLERLPRLAHLMICGGRDEGFAQYELHFGRDEAGRAVVRGAVRATLRLPCQRCGEVLRLPVDSVFALALVRGLDEAAQLPEAYEPLLPEEEVLDPATLIEDELLLAVPPVPRHAEGTCEAPSYSSPDIDAIEPSQAENPFAVLRDLKRPH